jgi:hypothetical protein
VEFILNFTDILRFVDILCSLVMLKNVVGMVSCVVFIVLLAELLVWGSNVWKDLF